MRFTILTTYDCIARLDIGHIPTGKKASGLCPARDILRVLRRVLGYAPHSSRPIYDL
jgi:hypothetical protein